MQFYNYYIVVEDMGIVLIFLEDLVTHITQFRREKKIVLSKVLDMKTVYWSTCQGYQVVFVYIEFSSTITWQCKRKANYVKDLLIAHLAYVWNKDMSPLKLVQFRGELSLCDNSLSLTCGTLDSPVYKIEIKKASYEIVDSMLCLGPSN